MQLDSTRIAIRERGFAEILDLSLRIVIAYFRPLVWRMSLTVVPLMILNDWLVGWAAGDSQSGGESMRYLGTMALLVFFEAPLMSVPMTVFLGKALFLDEAGWRDTWRIVSKTWFSLVWCQLAMRGLVLVWWIIFQTGEVGMGVTATTLVVLLSLYAFTLRAARPFINEIILLELNPLRSRGPGTLTVGKRSSSMHGPVTGKLMAEWSWTVILAVLLVLSLSGSVWFVRSTLLFNWNLDWTMVRLVIPLAMWIVASYMAVVRFMSYLDLRIRREGWEVELLVRAAATQLKGSPA